MQFFLPGSDKGTWENKKDGGTLVEEFETPVVDADLRGDKFKYYHATSS